MSTTRFSRIVWHHRSDPTKSSAGDWLAKDLVTSCLRAEFSTDEDFGGRVHKLAETDAHRQVAISLVQLAGSATRCCG